MDQIWKTVLAIVGSVGGAGLIIAFVGKWLAQLIADRIIQSKQQQFEKDQAEMRAKFELELEQYRTKAAEYTYVSHLQFETEFKVYQSLFDSLYDFGLTTWHLYPGFDTFSYDADVAEAEYTERYEEYWSTFNDFQSVLEKNAPFIPKHLYNSFIALRDTAYDLGFLFVMNKMDEYRFIAENKEIPKTAEEKYRITREFRSAIAKLYDDVRDYLATLRVQN